MPKATAVWLVDNTSLSFDQIAEFVGMHPLEVKGIADEDVAKGLKGVDPISNGQLTRTQIGEAEADPSSRLTLAESKYKLPQVKTKKTPRYTPVSKRQDKPDAIYWLLRNHPEMTDADVIKLIGTTKATISKIREREHWNSQNIKAVDPVTLGLCGQIELDFVVNRAANRKPRQPRKPPTTLKPIEDVAATTDAPSKVASADSESDTHPDQGLELQEPTDMKTPEGSEPGDSANSESEKTREDVPEVANSDNVETQNT
jgi:hypothetical protein